MNIKGIRTGLLDARGAQPTILITLDGPDGQELISLERDVAEKFHADLGADLAALPPREMPPAELPPAAGPFTPEQITLLKRALGV